MMWKKSAAVLLSAVVTLSAIGAPALAAEDSQAQSAREAVELAAQYGSAVSMQYALWEDGRITLSGHTGAYSKTENRALTDSTLYGIGSVSKVYTAAAVMKLVEEGKLSLDKPVVDYLPDFKMNDERCGAITVRMLLNHSSGLMGTSTNNAMLLGDFGETSATSDLLDRLAGQRLKADPGAFSVYCNDGFTLAELVVEQAAGMPFTDYLHEAILDPAGLDETYTPLDEFDRDLMAKTYLGEDTRALPPETLGIIGAGGLYATASDLAAFGGRLDEILTESSFEAMAENESVKGMWPEDSGDDALAYGLGWDNVQMYPFRGSGVQALVKGGDTQLYHAGLIVLPEYDMAVAVVSSGGVSSYNELAGAKILMDALAERGVEVKDEGALPEAEPAAMPAKLQEYAGVYANVSGFFTAGFTKGGVLTLTFPPELGGGVESYQYHSDGTFRNGKGLSLQFVTEENGRAYLYQRAYVDVPGLLKSPTASYSYERLPENKVSVDVQRAWDARRQKVYLMLNEKYTSAFYPLSGMFGRVQTVDTLPGYMGNNKLVEQDSARACLQIPGNMGRDLNDISFRTKKGVEYMTFGDFLLMDSAAAAPLHVGPGAYCTIQPDGYARWFQVEALSGKTLQVGIEGAGGFCVYGPNFKVAAASWAYGDTSAVLPKDGWVVFAGDPGTRFSLSLGE